jgi:hypothetical protein
LAGATTGNRLRTDLARRVAAVVRCNLLIGIASARPIGPSEHLSDPESAADGTEWRHLLRCFEDAFGPLNTPDVGTTARDGRDLAYVTADGTATRLLVAPDVDGRRPDTAQQLHYLCQRIPTADRRSVLLVTSAIYAPYQFFTAAPILLTEGTSYVELIGTPTTTDGDGDQLTQRLLQELHAAVDAAVPAVDQPAADR